METKNNSKKNANKVIATAVAVSLLTVAVLIFIMSIGYNNKEITLRNAVFAKDQAREAVFDEMWKTIKQVAKVSEKYSDDFKKVFPEIIAGRYNNRGGSLLSFITEANPTFDITLYNKLSNTIDIKRSEFTAIQKQLIDLNREHTNIIQTFPGSFFIRNQTVIDIQVISSDKSKEVMKTHKDNDLELF